ncbi:MAG TPA: RNA 2',3'-cyclic phosphodiesterase [Vicinamibacteria bacterium]|nr:RNA 2',3'-cyclic phosphodiesterase [Vicinamibacteria bacterium]
MGIRAFVALDLDQAARERLEGAIEVLKPQLAGMKWVRPNAIHLTLRFLGPSTPDALECLKPRLASAAFACSAADARLTGFGLFPERGAPRVLWVGLEFAAPLLKLQADTEAASVGCGFAPEPRRFAPHLTLGRWREHGPRPALPDVGMGVAHLDRLVLYRSELRRGGAIYTPLATFPLGG